MHREVAQPRTRANPAGDAHAGDTEGTGAPRYYQREIAARERLCEACPVEVFVSSQNPRWAWPWKLQRYQKAWPAIRDSCRTLAIDSGVTQTGWYDDVLDSAAKTDADRVFATDYAEAHENLDHEFTRANDTIEGCGEFIAHYNDHECDATVVWPLQQPYDECYRYLRDYADVVDDGSDRPHYAIGSLLSFETAQERIDAIYAVRELVGPDAHLHALGVGTELEVIREIRENPDLLDGLDVSTPETAPGNNKLPDATWQQRPHGLPSGDDVSTFRAGFSAALAMQLAYQLAGWGDGNELPDQEADLGRWCA
jgi:hypothetical protein